jgi:hypothetical protein
MFVLMQLINLCLRSVSVPFLGVRRLFKTLAKRQAHPLVTIPAPMLLHLV